MPDDLPPGRRVPEEYPEIDYLVCRKCNSPCYTFETEKGALLEAQCLVCGNDVPGLFAIEDQDDITDSDAD